MALKRIVAGSITVALAGCAALGLSGVVGGLGPQGSAAKAAGPDKSEAIADVAFNSPNRIDYRRIDDRLQHVATESGMVGLAIGIVENGEIRFLKGYGETAAGNGEPVTPDTVFRWASLSKGVAGDMVARLAGERKLALDAPVANYSATLRLPGGNEHKATLTDLLTHRLGIFSHAEEANLESGVDAGQLRGQLATLNATCPPGTCHAYQNVAFDAASEVVARATGKSYQEAVREQLFLPLGMTSASMTMDGLMASKSWARPHVGGGRHPRTVEVNDNYYRVPAAGGVNSSIKDLALWMKAQMGMDPEVLAPKVLANIQAPLASTPAENGRMRKYRERLSDPYYGLGWRVYNYAGHKVVGHWGGVQGYRSLIMFDPQLKTGVVALWNGSNNMPHAVEFEVLDMLYGLPSKDWFGIDRQIAASEKTASPA